MDSIIEYKDEMLELNLESHEHSEEPKLSMEQISNADEKENELNIEALLQVPSTILFPLELSKHLKEKLEIVLESNWHLTKNATLMEAELEDLRKIQEESKALSASVKKGTPSILSTKVIELSKKNRDMAEQVKGLKSKIEKLTSENEAMQKESCSNLTHRGGSDGSVAPDSAQGRTRADGSDPTNVSHQLAKTTSKIMELRRQNQLLQMELKSALRALVQEVGDGATPTTVLKQTSENTWRGRQQQIIALQQKVIELQLRLNQQSTVLELRNEACSANQALPREDDFYLYNMQNGYVGDAAGGGETFRSCSSQSLISNPAVRRQASTIQRFEAKKQLQLEKLNQEVTYLKNELKSSQLEAKGSKSRNQFLESQVRSFRIEIDELNLRLHNKEDSFQQAQDELKCLRHEIVTVREREKRNREVTTIELQEANHALARERNMVSRLQKVISEKQQHLQQLDAKVALLQDDAKLQTLSPSGPNNLMERIASLESQLQLATESILSGEKEREKLVRLISNSVGEAQYERQAHNEIDRLLSRSITILNLSDTCINRCLDLGKVTDKSVLEEVEELRSLIRELKAGRSNLTDFQAAKFQASKEPNSISLPPLPGITHVQTAPRPSSSLPTLRLDLKDQQQKFN